MVPVLEDRRCAGRMGSGSGPLGRHMADCPGHRIEALAASCTDCTVAAEARLAIVAVVDIAAAVADTAAAGRSHLVGDSCHDLVDCSSLGFLQLVVEEIHSRILDCLYVVAEESRSHSSDSVPVAGEESHSRILVEEAVDIGTGCLHMADYIPTLDSHSRAGLLQTARRRIEGLWSF